jgi:tetratricopeptide (TPR) repeat protein
LGVLDSNRVLAANPEKAVEILRMAAKAGQPWGLYDLGVAYEHGYGGVPYDMELAWAYYLRAAQLGSPEAQMALAEAYLRAGRFDDEEALLRCAYDQGHGAAAHKLAIRARTGKEYKEAIQKYQDGVKFGSSDCASSLLLLFKVGYWSTSNDEEKEELRRLGIRADIERSNRYRAIFDSLQVNPDLKLNWLDLVLPLPPEPLSPWSGIDDALDLESNARPTY